MLFKKKKKISWKKKGEFFYVYINGKEISGEISNQWSGNDLLIYLEVMNKYYLLQGYASAPKEEEFEAVFLAEGEEILWQKSGDGYFLYENGEAVQDNSTPYWIDDIFMVAYRNQDYLLKDYAESEENILSAARLINDEMQVSWIKKGKYFYLIADTLLDLNHNAHRCNDDLIVYVDDLEANMLLQNYHNCQENTFYETIRLAEKDQLIYRKTGKSNFSIFYNELDISADAIGTFVNDDVLIYLPKINYTMLFQNFKGDSGEDYQRPQILGNEDTAFWSADSDGFYLIDKGMNISPEVSNNNSRIGNHLLLFHPQSSTTYLFEDYLNRKDNTLRPAFILSRTANFVWAASNNRYKLWYQGKRVGECEHQMIGNDLMVMPKSLKKMVQMKDFVNCQDNRLRAVESI
ncbi:MAG: hypothetical protein K9N09_01275 [Candidatus Cloacimonetes bacterium]|nr:hypothetical protein [Candidatus Cloacimonadota bacterium]MCF7812963.1 hypothetical protein [Candidatus Cloacimonadota bacterium]MCF7867305.1 hypothetical protein [Candidatus Cloacimonadota bacterium]MCF7882749.1 hypothetical protein [Candidatus Cloacimonadota bacterium]